MATKKCMKCGGSMSKYAKGGQALNKAKGFAKPTTGGSNVADKIYGVPNAGSTGPNLQGIDTMKKGGSVKKMAKGGTAKKTCPPGYTDVGGNCIPSNKPFHSVGSKIGVAGIGAGMIGTGIKALSDKMKAKKAAKKESEEKKKKESETPKAKFGSSVNVQRGYPGKIRSAGDQGYTAVGKREPARTKFEKGGFPDLNKDGKVTKADVLVGRGVIPKAKKGGNWIQGAIKKPGALREQLGVKEGQKIPKAKLAAAAKKGGKLGQRARLAITLSKMHKK